MVRETLVQTQALASFFLFFLLAAVVICCRLPVWEFVALHLGLVSMVTLLEIHLLLSS